MNFNRWGYFRNCPIFGTLTWGSSWHGETSASVHVDAENSTVRLRDGGGTATISLATTPCQFGGVRHWFKCPKCHKRMRVLYIAHGCVACRGCQRLNYECQNLGGLVKQFGRIIPEPELEEMRKSLKKCFYRGVPTKKYQRYLRESEKTDRAMEMPSKCYSLADG